MARRLALWVGAGAAVAAVAIAAVLALPGAEPSAPTRDAALASTGSQAAAPASEVERQLAAAQAAAAAGRMLDAHTAYERAYALDPSPSTLLELAVLERRMGRCREARRTAQRAAASADRAVADRAQQLLATIGRCD
jgi:tetratricopeptide (TPR) repeat protein